MIKKPRTIPLMILMEEALLRRIPPTHQKREEIMRNLEKRWTGYRGEKNLDYHLSFLPEKDYYIFQDLRLVHAKQSCQLDTLILSPHFALIIESKNIYGTLFFDQHSRQLIRTNKKQEEEGFPDPIMQAKRHKHILQEWLQEQNIKSFPIEYLVAIGRSNTILRTNPGMHKIFQTILHAEHIPDKIRELEKAHKQKNLSTYLMNRLAHLLVQSNVPVDQETDILHRYSIQPQEILKGIPCPQCQVYQMIRHHGCWQCPHCGERSKTAHAQAIRDYLLLFHQITNRQCRDFLGISSIDLAKRLLLSMNLPYKGTTTNRIYGRADLQ